MTTIDRYREATRRNIAENGDTGIIKRQPVTDNGFGGLVPDGAPFERTVFCRVAMESMTDWHFDPVEQGVVNGQTPFLLAAFDADIQTGDVLSWRGKTYTAGNVTRPQRFGGVVSVQAPLTEVTV
jgi:hypothetical protein